MANRKFLFVNADQEIEEEVLSVSVSAGAADQGKLATLDADGKWDISLLPDSVINGVDWKDSVRVAAETNLNLAAPGASIDGVALSNGDRFLAAGQTTASENGIYVFNGAATPATRSTDADEDAEVTSQLRVAIEEGTRADQTAYLATNDPITVGVTNLNFQFNNPVALVGGDGIDISGGTVSVDLSADSGLEFSGGLLQINFADTSVAADLDGTNGSLAIRAEDLSGNGANQGANIIGADPSSISQSSSTTVQGILNDLSTAIENSGKGVEYTVGAGGVTAGDLVYVSANDTILPLDINASEVGIGLALTTAAAAATVTVAANDVVIPGVLAGATAGDKYYWDGSSITATPPSGAGSRVWQVGVAKNATDLHVEVLRIKRNSI